MTNQEILFCQPKGATHINNTGTSLFRDKEDDIRSLADIKRIAELEKERAVRDLEQQAKGLEDYVSKTMDNSYILHLDPENIQHCILINLNAAALRLLERAKALKEQEDER